MHDAYTARRLPFAVEAVWMKPNVSYFHQELPRLNDRVTSAAFIQEELFVAWPLRMGKEKDFAGKEMKTCHGHLCPITLLI